MANIARLFNFMPSTLIQSSQVNQELSQLVNLLNGTSSNFETVLVNNDPANAALRVNQINTGPIIDIRSAGALQGRFMPNAFLQQQYVMILGPTGSFGSLPAISLGNNGFVYGHTSSDPPLSTSGFSVYGTGSNNLFVIHSAAAMTGAALSLYQFPDIIQKVNWLANGKLRIRAGFGATQPGSFVVVGGHAQGDFLTRQSAATGSESILLSQAFVGNFLSADGEYLVAEYAGTFANNSNTKRLRFTYAGQQIYDTGPIVLQQNWWTVKITIVRDSGTTCKVLVNFQTASFSADIMRNNVASIAVTHSLINSLVSLGTGTLLGDTTQEFFTSQKYCPQ